MRRLIAVVAVVVAVSACGSTGLQTTTTLASTTSTVATTSTTMAPTTTVPEITTTTIDEVAVAGEQYLELVGDLNCVIFRHQDLWDEIADEDGLAYEEDWPQVRDVYLAHSVELGQAYVAFVEGLSAYQWPDVIKADIEALTQESAQKAAWSQQYSQIESWQRLLDFDLPAPVGDSATVVRAKLGLPTNIGLESSGDC